MTLQQFCTNLPEDKRTQLAITLAKLTLPVWNNFADKHKLSYRDSIVGLKHPVDRNLLENSINEIETSCFKTTNRLLELYNSFIDPIVALQDDDWVLPNPVQKTFYSVYNLLESVIGKEQAVSEDSVIYVSINQAVDALETSKTLTEDEIKKYLLNSDQLIDFDGFIKNIISL